jgi:hypothetical protein
VNPTVENSSGPPSAWPCPGRAAGSGGLVNGIDVGDVVILGRCGRARALRQLDDALRAADVHPALVPDTVQLTAERLLQAEHNKPEPVDYAAAAERMARPSAVFLT